MFVKHKKQTAKKIATLSVLTALSMIIFIIESYFPPLFIPGAKMGLANIFTLFTLVLYGPIEAIIVVVLRTFLGSIFAGNLSAILYSTTAGLVSVILSSILIKFVFPKISLLAISILSAVAHNLTQLLVYCTMAKTFSLFAYAPYLALLGILAGTIVGLAVHFIIKYIPTNIFSKVIDSNS